MRSTGAAMAILALLLLVAFVPFSDTSDADTSGDITWFVSGGIEMKSNQTGNISISIYNNGADAVHVRVTHSDIEDVSISMSKTDFELKPKDSSNFSDRIDITVTLKTSKYASSYDGSLTFTMTTVDMATGTSLTAQQTVPAKIHSAYADGDGMGKIMGYVSNPLPDPYSSPLASALITLVIWILISAVISSLTRILCNYAVDAVSGMSAKKKLIDTSSFRKTWKYIFGIVMMYGLENTMVVLGVDDNVIGTFSDVTDIITVLFIAMTIWHIFTTVANVIAYKFTEDGEESSLKPLCLLIGRLFIIMGTLIVIMVISGIDPASIALALGLAVTGISFGAKTVITQFLSGIQIMINRIIRTGDKIKVGADPTTLIVKDIGIMTTRCKNWSNEEIFYIPNSSIADAKVVNITKDNVYYKVYDYYGIDHNADINRAREIMVEVAYGDVGVVADGSFSKPDVRFSTVNNNEISLRLAYTVVDHEDYGVISARIREQIFKRFKEEGIDIPYPQYEIRAIPVEKDPPDT
ncbi:MAG: mechanosensitive ion channel family protein [Candidatus Methanomethylophilaceae archaeon]|nr:mechanosensitive ion channel family protein [Candidatus Methanomethylophilaceae archaeon]